MRGSGWGELCSSFFVCALLAACTTGSSTKPERDATAATKLSTPAPVADAAAEEADASEPPAAGDPPPTAWTDAVHVDGLVRDCAYGPADMVRPKGMRRSDFEGSALSCMYGLYPQVCADDPCLDEQLDVCAVGCERSCESCATTCKTSCTTCKAKCAKGDAACARACATTCASCRQECVTAKDRCSTGTCTNRYEECKKTTRIQWDKSGCGAACKGFHACIDACPEGEKRAKCTAACEAKLGPCVGRFRQVCKYNGRLFGAIED